MAMYNKIITFLMLTFIVSISFAQQYTPMTAAGYQYKRAKVDSTLHIPSFCGVPNLRNSTAIQGALAMDTCGNKLYQWTHAAGWSTISTNAIDSLKRSNDSIFARKSGVWIFQYKDSTGSAPSIPILQQVLTAGNSSNIGNYNLTLQESQDAGEGLKVFNSYNLDKPWIKSELYIGNTNIEPYFNFGWDGPSADISTNSVEIKPSGIMFNSESYGYYHLNVKGKTHNSPYELIFPLPQDIGSEVDTVATLRDIRTNTIDTSNKWVNNIYRTSGVDSIYYTIGSTTYAIKDSAGGGSSQNGRFGNDTATIVMAKVHNNSGSTLTNGKVVFLATSGTNSDAPSVRLANNKADSTSANTFGFVSGSIANNDTGWVILSGKIEKLNTSAYSNGDIIYLDSVSGNWTKTKPVAPYHMVYLGVVVKSNAGNGSIFVKCQNGYELDEIHDVQITSKQNNQVLAYSDTQKVWKNRNIYSIVDTTNLIATKTNVAAKINISDTASMLTPYLRSNTASATYLAKSDSTTYYTKYRSDTSRTNIYNALNGKQNTLTFSTGLTNSANTITNNLSTGVSGGQSVVGGTAASNNLTLSSTTNATKGNIILGTTNYFENTNNLAIGSNTDAGFKLDVNGTARVQGDITSTSAVKATTSSATTQFSLITPVTTNYPRGRIQVGQSASDGNVGIYFNPLYSSAGVQKPVFFALATNYNIADATEMTGSFFLNTSVFNCGTAKADGTLSGGVPITFSPAGSEAIRFNTNGNIQFPATNTATGTTGNQTINKTSGTVNIAAAGTTVTVTNNLVTTSSIVFAVIRTNDATATIKNVVPASGSFTINLNAATTAETSIGFFVIN